MLTFVFYVQRLLPVQENFLIKFQVRIHCLMVKLLILHIFSVINGFFFFFLVFRVSKCVQKSSIKPLRCMIK